MDEQLAQLKNAVLAGMPECAPADALAKIGKDRKMPRAPGETDAEYASRLKDAWTFWEDVGSAFGLLKELKVHGFPSGTNGAIVLQQNGTYYQLDDMDPPDLVTGNLMQCVNRKDLTGATPGTLRGWTFDVAFGNDQQFAQFGILFPVDVPTLTTGSEDAARLNEIVVRSQPGKARFYGVWVVVTGEGFGWPASDARTFGSGGTWGGNTIRYIEPTTQQ
ncbi:MAG: hypothetical protein F6J89_17845 [Symploca sp. SIO1C4]|uniref:Uncharacterized protein n=1 Tax=Symploca sp. SIO1C4 TaxID=2607765 RepID=A0A6B3NCY4_9CYAN|nr:hypothetical protein [Symploca sp. SIO1C4]